MPELLKRDVRGTTGPRGSIKPEWLDGRPRLFRRGDDFSGRPEEFARKFRHAARKAGMLGKCQIIDDNSVEGQAYRETTS